MHRTVVLALIVIVIMVAACGVPQGAPAQTAPRSQVYLPAIYQPSPLPTATPDDLTRCMGNAKAAAFYWLLVADRRQARAIVGCHPALVKAARLHAQSFADGAPWQHCAGAVCPNALARRAGCNLPATYADDANYVEELVEGTGDSQAAFDALARSERHSVHLFARERDGTVNPFFVQQDDVGIAYAESLYGLFWVVMIAPCGETSGE